MDEPGYRYSRVVYPFLARLISFGRPAAVPLALLIINLAAVAGGTYALALLLRLRGASPVFAALYGLAPGLYIAVKHDLSEPLAYALVLAALVAWWWDDDRQRPWLVGAIFALAVLTRESTYLFPLALAVAALLGLQDGLERRRDRDVRSALIVGGVALLPYLVLRLLLLAWLGSSGSSPEAERFALVPLGGLLSHWPLNSGLLEQLWGVVLPSLVALGLVVWFTRRLGPTLIALVLNVAVLVVFLPTPSYDSLTGSARIALGVVCAFLACLPLIPSTARAEVALVVAVLGMAPWFALFPEAFGR